MKDNQSPKKAPEKIATDLAINENLDLKLATMLKSAPEDIPIKSEESKKQASSNTIEKTKQSPKDFDSFHTKIFENLSDEDQFEEPMFESKVIPNKIARQKGFAFSKRAAKFAQSVLKNAVFQVLINLFTTFILFGDYIRIMAFRQQADIYFDIIVILSIFIFAFEFVLNILADSKYVNSFYFWMDLIMCVFIVLNISEVSNVIFYSASEKVTEITTKLAKFLRLIRIIRFLKYFQTKSGQGQNKAGREKAKVENKSLPQPRLFRPKESRVTIELKELNIKRLIILILVMWILIPLFDFEIYTNPRTRTNKDKVSLLLFNLLKYPSLSATFIAQIQGEFQANSQFLSKLFIEGVVDYQHEDFANLRLSDQITFNAEIEFRGLFYKAKCSISIRFEAVIQALLDLLNTLLLGVIMIFSIWNLNHDMSTLILNPLERMITKIKQVALNPLHALKKNGQVEAKGNEMNETLVIEEAINKISELLMLGFGQAGCRIISHILFEKDREIDELFQGEKTYAIFGFCYITEFTALTEVLQEDVMMFVNTIAEIVHCSVDDFSGAANKNIGDAFLLVWKLLDNGYKYFHDSEFKSRLQQNQWESSKLKQIDYNLEDSFNRQLAELSLLSFIQVIIQVNTSRVVRRFSQHPRVLEKLPGYQVKMGFGLHLGWAIEGAIGSSFKIDASYLSPNVNMAARLEAATKQFGVEILLSGALFELFTTRAIIELCRHIDTVMVKGSRQPVKLYTIDLNVGNLVENQLGFAVGDKKLRALKREQKDELKQNFKVVARKIRTIEENPKNSKLFESQIQKIQSCEEETLVNKTLMSRNFKLIMDYGNIVNQDYRQKFKFGVNAYLDGEWALAKKFFEKCFKVKANDKPASVLYKFIQGHNFLKPENWNKCRELTEK